MPCCRHNSAVANPASPCFRIAMICSSLCRVPFMVVLLSGFGRTHILGGPVFGGYVIGPNVACAFCHLLCGYVLLFAINERPNLIALDAAHAEIPHVAVMVSSTGA